MNKENKEPRDENGERHGYWEIYFPNGQLDYKTSFIHGVYHGMIESYTISGRLFYKGFYQYNTPIGLTQTYVGNKTYIIL